MHLSNEIDFLNNDNKDIQNKYDEELKKFANKYDIILLKYNEKRRKLEILIEQLKYKQKRNTLNLRILDRLKNPDKFNQVKEKLLNQENKIDLKNEEVKLENNIEDKKLKSIPSSKKRKKK